VIRNSTRNAAAEPVDKWQDILGCGDDERCASKQHASDGTPLSQNLTVSRIMGLNAVEASVVSDRLPYTTKTRSSNAWKCLIGWKRGCTISSGA
jgi:hypothetical protein